MDNLRLSDFMPYLDWIESQHKKMQSSLVLLSEINSGTFNISGLSSILKEITRLTKVLKGTKEIISLKPFKQVNTKGEIEIIPVGNALRICKYPDAKLKVFLCVHIDTVFGPDSDFQKTSLLKNNILNGPGVADAKGGLLVMITALTALEKSPWAGNIGWEMVVNPDEEIGSPGSFDLLEKGAKNNDLGMVFEPSFPDGSLASERGGTGNFTAVARGRAAHAGRDFQKGRNAIRALSDFLQAIDDLNGVKEGLIVNPGFIQGGGPENMVPDFAMLKFNLRVARPDDEAWVTKQIEGISNAINNRDGLSLELSGLFNRKPKIPGKAENSLMEMIGQCGADLGINLKWQSTRGCCDGNNLAAAGLPNVDNLGVHGGEIHTKNEFVYLDSLTQRAKLSALFLMKLASGQIRWK